MNQKAPKGKEAKSPLFLYDVTSSYLEGRCNALGAFGYNRDRKRGKRQIVIGLLCDALGEPVSIQAFAGNTQDTATLPPQLDKVADRFGGGPVTLVGDRGMIKGPGTGTSDSIPGVIVDSSGRPQRGILVSNGESILTKEVTSKLGKPTIDWLNSNADKLATGGVVGEGVKAISEARNMPSQATKSRSPSPSSVIDFQDAVNAMNRVADSASEQRDLNLNVTDSALDATLRDYIEGYLSDVVARR